MLSSTSRVASSTQLATAPPLQLHKNPSRQFVTREVQKLLMNTKVYHLANAAFKFQSFGLCAKNTSEMHTDYAKSLVQEGIAREVPQPDAGVATQAVRRFKDLVGMDTLSLQMKQMGHPTAEDVERCVASSGAVTLSLKDVLPQKDKTLPDGSGEYAFHEVLVINTFRHNGSIFGIAVDGNDLQKNPVMEYIGRYAQQHGIDLDKLNADDLAAVQRTIDEDGVDLHVDQVKFTVINLTAAIERSEKADANAVKTTVIHSVEGPPVTVKDVSTDNRMSWASNMEVVNDPIPASVLDDIKKSIDNDPQHTVFYGFGEE